MVFSFTVTNTGPVTLTELRLALVLMSAGLCLVVAGRRRRSVVTG